MPKKKKGTNELPFGKILRSIMSERGLTVRAVAEMAGVSSSVVQGWISKSVPHDLAAVSRLAQALGISFKGLLLGQQETVTHATTLEELFEEQDFFEGVCKINIKRLLPRKQGESK
ncbi:MAG: helix-turn-helix transcriptional regulator [Bdellovibrionales bacterium]|nr:helix-turn-helix transcriptional regulator [Bdellovibrionales bacterium]